MSFPYFEASLIIICVFIFQSFSNAVALDNNDLRHRIKRCYETESLHEQKSHHGRQQGQLLRSLWQKWKNKSKHGNPIDGLAFSCQLEVKLFCDYAIATLWPVMVVIGDHHHQAAVVELWLTQAHFGEPPILIDIDIYIPL